MKSEKTRKICRSDYFIKKIKLLRDVRSPIHQKLVIFLFFVVVSSAFWFIRSLSEEYETVVDYPVRYINYPEGKVLIGEVPDKLTLRINASGFSVLKSRLNLNIIPLKFDVNSFSLNSIGADTFYILTETVKDILSEELNQVQILGISPDTLFFRFNTLEVKKIPVKPIMNMHDKFFQVQYMQNGEIDIIPDSIIISGPSTILNTMTFVYTKPIKLNNLSDTAELTAGLQMVDKINYSQERVKVIVPVDKFTEVEQNLPVISIHVPDSLEIIAIPGQVRIAYQVCLSNYNKTVSKPLLLYIDYMKMEESRPQRLSVFLSDTPQFISNIRINPKDVEFLIRRK